MKPDFSCLTYSSLYRYKKQQLKNLDDKNIDRENLQKMVEEDFEKLEIDKKKFITEFFAQPKDSYLEEISRKNKR